MTLDTLPYNGHTTSLDSLWMGVPVVTCVGRTVVGRAGYSQLSNLGLSDLVACERRGIRINRVEFGWRFPSLVGIFARRCAAAWNARR